ncbi:MAG: hypothetical protein CSA26_05750 [Desulfobacterales bacterium]|nr:MAG: hypothetical protein CSA26_05750 [Desulfobacterales bacterium]
MIFVTVGSQLPFDRLIRIMDGYAKETNEEVIGQIGKSSFRPQYIKWCEYYNPDSLNNIMESAELIVSHAGMGTIISAIKIRKPIIIFHRRHELNEVRNDHQLDTMDSFREVEGVYPAYSQEDLLHFLTGRPLPRPAGLVAPEREELCQYILSML